MFLYEWFIPLLILLVIALSVFFISVRRSGGPGVRTDGRTVVDKSSDEETPPEQ